MCRMSEWWWECDRKEAALDEKRTMALLKNGTQGNKNCPVRGTNKGIVQLEVRNRNWWLKAPRIETRSEKYYLMKTGKQLKL